MEEECGALNDAVVVSFLQILNAEPVQDAPPLPTASSPLLSETILSVDYFFLLSNLFGVFILYMGPFLLYTRVCNSCVPFLVLPV